MLFITGYCISAKYTEFEYDSLAGKYPSFLKPMKASLLKDQLDKAESAKTTINSDSYKMLKNSISDFDTSVIEVFLRNREPIFSITINYKKSNHKSNDDQISDFVKDDSLHNWDLIPKLKLKCFLIV